MKKLRRRADRAIADRLVRTDALLATRRKHLHLLRTSIQLRMALLPYRVRNASDAERRLATGIASFHRLEGTLERCSASLGDAIDRELTRASPNLFCA